MNTENKELPSWTFKGGHFRSGFSTNDVPTEWTRKKGRWTRDELVPYGKAAPEYREKFYLCPECQNSLQVSEKPYHFECADCGLDFRFSFGGLGESAKVSGRFELSDLYV